MSDYIEFTSRAVAIGVGATAIIDVYATVLRWCGVPSLSMALLGRWVAHGLRGHWRHVSIATADPVRAEQWIGWAAHYAIGITFAALLLVWVGPEWARTPTLAPALAIGVGTVVAPWFLLQPAMGAGIASSKTPRPLFNATKSLVTHLVFGLGLYVSGLLVK